MSQVLKDGYIAICQVIKGFLGESDGKESACSAGDLGLIPRSARSLGEGNGYPLQYSSLENPMDRGAWWAAVHGVTKSQTRLKQLNTHTHVNMHATSSLAIYLSMDTKIASVS